MVKLDFSSANIESRFCSAISDYFDQLDSGIRDLILHVSLYGSLARKEQVDQLSDINLLIILSKFSMAQLEIMVREPVKPGEVMISPFFLTQIDLERSLDVFPGKFLSIIQDHKTIAGPDMLSDLKIDRSHLRLRCEQEIKNLLFFLRRGYLRQHGTRLEPLLRHAEKTMRETLFWFLEISGKPIKSRREIPTALAEQYKFNEAEVAALIGLNPFPMNPTADFLQKQFSATLELTERMAVIVDEFNL
ncbi:MAG: hypothetical protein ACOYXC_22355 [Candidatus Rifleibacteriota bacterium]